MKEVTRILTAIEAGDRQAAEALLPIVYNELRRLAARKMSQERPDHTLQTIALGLSYSRGRGHERKLDRR